jgi:hypothetical protein
VLSNGRDEEMERDAVMWFAADMCRVLRDNRHKPGWRGMPDSFWLEKLEEEYIELRNEVARAIAYEPEWELKEQQEFARRIGREATDLANVCMMISDHFGQLGLVDERRFTD